MEEFIGEGGRGLGFGLVVEDKGASEKIKNQILSPITESEFESDSRSRKSFTLITHPDNDKAWRDACLGSNL